MDTTEKERKLKNVREPPLTRRTPESGLNLAGRAPLEGRID
jgi:hypothetical protein